MAAKAPSKLSSSSFKAFAAALAKKVAIILRADSGFCRDETLTWIESQRNLYYVVGLAKNSKLSKLLAPTYEDFLREHLGKETYEKSSSEAKSNKSKQIELPEDLQFIAFAELRYRTQKSWSCERRVIGKAAITNGKINPRFLVTNLTGAEDFIQKDATFLTGQAIYENFYCARGDMENRIKEQQMDLFADRTSTGRMASNQLRLYFSTFAYLLMGDLRAGALAGTRLSKASVGQIRLKLFKIAAQLIVSVRRIHIRMCSACPMADVFAVAHERLRTASG